MKYIILVKKFRCKTCGQTGYVKKDIHYYRTLQCSRARYEEIEVEEIYAGMSYHGKLSDYKVVRTERENGDQ